MQKSDVAGRARPSETSPSEAVTSRIPDAELERFYGALCRRIAAALLEAMAHRGADFTDIDARLEWKPGQAKRAIVRLMSARGGGAALRDLADIAYALDCSIRIRLEARASRDTQASPEETEASQAKPPHTPVED